MRMKCRDGITRSFSPAYNDGDYARGKRIERSAEAACLECKAQFGVHDLKVLKPMFYEHCCAPKHSSTIETLGWKVHTPNLLEEILRNEGASALRMPLIIFAKLLEAVASRASELHDPELDKLMIRLTMYEMADPTSKGYDQKKVSAKLREVRFTRPEQIIVSED